MYEGNASPAATRCCLLPTVISSTGSLSIACSFSLLAAFLPCCHQLLPYLCLLLLILLPLLPPLKPLL